MARQKRNYDLGKRAISASATRQAIVQAARGLFLTQWYDEVSLQRVAEHAAVSLATVTRHFSSKLDLLAASLQEGDTSNLCRPPIPGDIADAVDQLVDRYEQVGEAMIRMEALRPRVPELQALHETFVRPQMRGWLAAVCAPMLPRDKPARERILDTVEIALDIYAWKRWRSDMGRTVAETKRELARAVTALLASER